MSVSGVNVRGRNLSSTDSDNDLDWFFPPGMVSDPGEWDNYWQAQVAHGVGELTDMFCDDEEVVDAMREGCGECCVSATASRRRRELWRRPASTSPRLMNSCRPMRRLDRAICKS
jgi:hypothetical protein